MTWERPICRCRTLRRSEGVSRGRPVEPTALHLIVPALGPGGAVAAGRIDLYRADYSA